LFLAALLLLAPIAHAQHGGGGTMPAITAPREATQFDFLIGQWELEVTPKVSGLAAMIHGKPKLHGSWKAWRAFDGFGIEDELRIVDGSGNPKSLNQALRVYAAAEKRWLITVLDVYRARFTSAVATRDGNEVHQDGKGTDAEGKSYLSRTRFHEITADGFRMQQDRSSDNGQSWDDAVLTMVAKRTAATAAR
jgi:hypothetical protein